MEPFVFQPSPPVILYDSFLVGVEFFIDIFLGNCPPVLFGMLVHWEDQMTSSVNATYRELVSKMDSLNKTTAFYHLSWDATLTSMQTLQHELRTVRNEV